MENIIDVVSGFTLTSHNSFNEALLSSEDSTSSNARDEELVDKSQVIDYLFSRDQFALALSNGKYLLIFTCNKKIGWSVSDEKPDIKAIEPIPPVMFRYESGLLVEWNWKRYLDEIVGKTIRLSLSDQLLFILVRGQEEYYCINYVRERDNTDSRYLTIDYA